MRSIKALFQKNQKENNLGWGDYTCLAEAVRGKRFKRKVLGQAMSKLLIEGVDYQSSEKKEDLDHLENFSNPLEESKNEGINPLQNDLISKKVICTNPLVQRA